MDGRDVQAASMDGPEWCLLFLASKNRLGGQVYSYILRRTDYVQHAVCVVGAMPGIGLGLADFLVLAGPSKWG